MVEIDFPFSGGYANLHRSFKANFSDLPNDTAKQINKMIDESEFFNEEFKLEPEKTDVKIPDIFNYELMITRNGQTKKILFTDITMPKKLGPHVSKLRQLAIEKNNIR